MPDWIPQYPSDEPPKVVPIPPASNAPPKAVPIPDGTPPASSPPAIRIPGDSTRHPTGRFSGPNNRTK